MACAHLLLEPESCTKKKKKVGLGGGEEGNALGHSSGQLCLWKTLSDCNSLTNTAVSVILLAVNIIVEAKHLKHLAKASFHFGIIFFIFFRVVLRLMILGNSK